MMAENATKIWWVGHSMRGYLPESAPYYTTDHSSAVGYTKDELESLADYFCQGMSQNALSAVANTKDGKAESFIKWLEETRTEPITHFNLEDMDMDCIYRLEECEAAIDSLGELERDEEWWADVHHYHYWIQEVDRSEFEIPEDLEGEMLEEMIEDLNQEMW